MRNLLSASHDADLIECSDLRRQPTVDTEDFAVDNGCKSEEVKDLTAGLPDAGVAVFGLAFFVKAVHLGDLAGFVVATD